MNPRPPGFDETGFRQRTRMSTVWEESLGQLWRVWQGIDTAHDLGSHNSAANSFRKLNPEPPGFDETHLGEFNANVDIN